MKFELTANAAIDGGFKIKAESKGLEELESVQKMISELINKIEKITINIDQSNEQY